MIYILKLHLLPLKCLQKQHSIPDWVYNNNAKLKINIILKHYTNVLGAPNNIMLFLLRMLGIQERNTLFILEKILGVKLCLNLCQSPKVSLKVLLTPNTSF